MCGITIIALMTGAVMALLSTLMFQYNQACIRQKGLQIAVSAMENGKYRLQKEGDVGLGVENTDDLYKVEQVVQEKSVHAIPVKELQVRVYYKEELIISLATNVWEGFK
ncbi:MAG: hypothetical protein KHZ77_06930 [Veillonella sp.]|uniref:hypothetical protein n=1 Tax=Veillonella sp. TaxID=1926307 RepID=UPI0025EB2E2A|nr:hypothetical protein [Veillonella sp.]MBS4913885.1 hypothetical protein [Veillonella sp.]